MKISSRPRISSPGFTLIEVLLAVTIFAIAMSALFVTFRTGIKAWKTGHRASEVFQTARVAKEVMMRDLHNLAYRSELDYNSTFRDQVAELAALMSAPAEDDAASRKAAAKREKAMAKEAAQETETARKDQITLGDLAFPIDLSFHGEDNALLDSLSFAINRRIHTPDERAQEGYTRVRYSVRDGVLYREEQSVLGIRPGQDIKLLYEVDQAQGEIARLFVPPGEAAEPKEPLPGFGKALFRNPFARERTVEGTGVLPDSRGLVEPLCTGVKIFNVTYGYYRFDQWNEVPSWDSSNFKYRFPGREGGLVNAGETFGSPAASGGPLSGPAAIPMGLPTASPETSFNLGGRRPPRTATLRKKNKSANGVTYEPQPDNLPGYIAIQLGIRDPDSGGRMQSFTFFISLPLAREEFDTTAADDTEDGVDPASASAQPPSGSGAKKLFIN